MCLKKKRNLLNDKRIYTGRSKRKVNASFLRNLEKYQNYDIKNYYSLEQFAKDQSMSLATLRKLLKEYNENPTKFLEERFEKRFEERFEEVSSFQQYFQILNDQNDILSKKVDIMLKKIEGLEQKKKTKNEF